MKIKISVNHLKEALQVAGKTAEKKASGLTSHYLFELKGGELSVCTHMARRPLFTIYPIPEVVKEDVAGDSAFTIECTRLDKMVETLGDEALSLEFDGTYTHVTSSRGKLSFRSLNPDAAPSWEEAIRVARKVATVPARVMRTAMSYVKVFAREDLEKPSTSIAQFRQGALLVTDRVAVVRVAMDEIARVDTSLHVKDLSSIAGFLGHFNDAMVSIRQHDRLFLIQAGNGGKIGALRPPGKFPDISRLTGRGSDHLTFDVPCEEARNAILYLSSGALWNTQRLLIQDKGEEICLSMESTTEGTISIDLPIENRQLAKDAPNPMGGEGFAVSYGYLLKVLAQYEGGDKITFAANEWETPEGHPRAGWLSFFEERNGASYHTVVTRVK